MPYQTVTMTPMDSPFSEIMPAAEPCRDRRALPAGARMAEWRAPDGWPHRRFRLGSGARGALLFLGGRGDMIEKYLEPMAHWADRGWSVTSFDWRGQGGSGRLAAAAGVGHVEDFSVWISDLSAFVAQWRAEHPGPHVIVAHSMGGHLLLRALVENSVRADALVMVAPMFGLNAGPLPPWLGARIARLMCRIGDPARPAWSEGDKPLEGAGVRQARLTHSIARYADEVWWRRTHPEIALGPPSWRWLEQAYRSTAMVARSPRLSAVHIPTLILATRADRLVSPAAIRAIAARLPDARLHFYGGEAAHEILREEDAVRNDALSRIDGFLDECAPMGDSAVR